MKKDKGYGFFEKHASFSQKGGSLCLWELGSKFPVCLEITILLFVNRQLNSLIENDNLYYNLLWLPKNIMYNFRLRFVYN